MKKSRKNFGKIVQKLRKNTTRMTQVSLNERLDLPEKTIERIEQGRVKFISTELLMMLADEFNLTTIERKEFFFAAIAPDNDKLVSKETSPKIVLNELVSAMEDACLPAFVNNVFGDVVAANNLVLHLLNAKDALARTNGEIDQYNLMRFLFEDNSIYKEIVGERWQTIAIQNIGYFRRMSLRYMAEPYYDKLFVALNKYDSFSTFWQIVSGKEFVEDRERSDIVIYEYQHPIYGNIKYIATDSRALTQEGEFYFVQYAPANENTRRAFDRIRENISDPCKAVFLAPINSSK